MSAQIIAPEIWAKQRAPGRPDAGGEPPYDGGMEARVARLEATVQHIQSDLTELKEDVRELRRDVGAIRTTDFRIMYGSMVAGILGLAAILAHGFHWI